MAMGGGDILVYKYWLHIYILWKCLSLQMDVPGIEIVIWRVSWISFSN